MSYGRYCDVMVKNGLLKSKEWNSRNRKMAYYIPQNLQWSYADIQEMDTVRVDDDIPVSTIIGVHHAYHSDDADFDGGLSLLDFIHKKLNKPFKLNWDVESMKNLIRRSSNPSNALVGVLTVAMTREMIAYYGL